MNIYYVIAFVCYFAFFFCLSLFFYHKNKNTTSFILADRSVSYWVAAIAAQASDMSDWLLMAYPGLIYGLGLFNAWVAIGLTFFMYLNWTFIAPQLRIATEKYNSLTLASFFEARFKDSSGILRLMTVFFTFYFLVFYIAAELIGLGRLFETTFNINYNIGIAISIFLVVVNIVLGGFAAVAWGDLFRGLFLLVSLLFVPWYVCNYTSVCLNISATDVVHILIPDFSLTTISSILLLAFGWGLGYFGSPHILINFMGIKEVNKIRAAKRIGLAWQLLVLSAATCIGLLGKGFFSLPLANRELVYIEIVKNLFHPLVAGFILCAILAATMSVMTAQILATASNVCQDFIERLFTKRISSKMSLWILRSGVLFIPLVSYALSYNSTSAVNDLVSYAWSGLGLAFAPVVIAALYLPTTNNYGAITGMLLGGITGMVWPYLQLNFLPLLPGFFIISVVIVAVSKVTK